MTTIPETIGRQAKESSGRGNQSLQGLSSERVFVTGQDVRDPDPFGAKTWGVRPQVRAGDAVLFFIRQAGLAYAAKASSSAVKEEGARWATADFDEKSWHRLEKPLPVRELQGIPELSEWKVLPRLSHLDDVQPDPLEEPILSALVGAIEQRNPGFLGWLRTPASSPDDLLFSRLDASSRKAIGRADALRQAMSKGEIHMEHLVLGLFGDEGGYPRQVFSESNVNESELFELVALGEAPPTHYEPSRPTRMPPLSSHARRALDGANAVAGTDGRLMDPRDLLEGALLVTDCRVIQRLGEHGVTTKPRDLVNWVMDTPATRDRLGRKPFASSLARRLQRINEEYPESFLVHIDGAWGTGKSTLLDLLRDELKQRGFVSVEVNAWREQRIGPPWWSLLTALWRYRREDVHGARRLKVWFQDLLDRLQADWVPFAAAVLILVGLAVGVFFLVGPDMTAAGAQAQAIASIVGLAVSVVAGSAAAARFLLLGSANAARVFVKASDNPMQGIVSQFTRTLRRIGKPVVFFIDDLDRCSETYVVEFLEAIQTLVRDASDERADPASRNPRRGRAREPRRSGGPFFVVAADGRWIRVSYEKGYEAFGGTQGPARPLGWLFLDKIFQLTVRLPRITDGTREGYLAWLLRQQPELTGEERAEETAKVQKLKKDLDAAGTERQMLNVAEQAKELRDHAARLDLLGDAAMKLADPNVEAKTVHALQPFAKFLDPNPRTIKRFVNAYGMLRAQRTLEAVFADTNPLALWTIVELRWPVLAEYLRAHPEQVSEVGAESPDVQENLREIFSNEEVAAVVNDSKYGPLTPELVKACGGPPA